MKTNRDGLLELEPGDQVAFLLQREGFLPQKGVIHADPVGGIEIKLEGYGDHSSNTGEGAPIYIEQGSPACVEVHMWKDINDPTPSTVCLEFAKESNRKGFLGSLAGTVKFGPGWEDPLPSKDWNALSGEGNP